MILLLEKIMNNKLLVQFYWDCGRMGDIDGLFVTTQEQLNLWYNGNDEEHKLATYLEGVYQEYYESGQEDESRYETGFEVGYDSGYDCGYTTGYIDGQEK